MANSPIDVYQAAVQRVPAYRNFLQKNCGQVPVVKDMSDFEKLPYMDKPGYILPYPLAERCLDGTLLGKHVIMHSSGTSGKYQYWPCIPENEVNYSKNVYAELNENYDIGRKSTLVVLGVLMGGNMSGALFAYALRALALETGRITLVTPGREEDACIEDIANFSAHFEQTILYSYPATAKNIIENAVARGIPVQDFKIRLRLLGEGYSEAFRDRINQLLGYPYGCLTSANSGYGATDFRSAGKETLLCIAIKRLLHEQGKIQEVLGFDEMRTICQYDPNAIYIEEDDGELIMTKNNAVPLVRYRSGDAGMIMPYEEMMAILAKHALDPFKLMQERGCDPAKTTNRPFVLVGGRRNDSITFHGTKIFLAKIKAVLEETPFLAARFTGEFQVRKGEDANLDPYLEIRLVPRPDSGELNAAEIANILVDALSARQGGIFSSLLAKNRAAALPRISFVQREEIMTAASFKIRYLG